jgi:hypothetical protein
VNANNFKTFQAFTITLRISIQFFKSLLRSTTTLSRVFASCSMPCDLWVSRILLLPVTLRSYPEHEKIDSQSVDILLVINGEDSYGGAMTHMVASAGSCFTDQPHCAASPQASHRGLAARP